MRGHQLSSLEPLVALAPDLTAWVSHSVKRISGHFPTPVSVYWGSPVVRTLFLEYLAGISKTTSFSFTFDPLKINSRAMHRRTTCFLKTQKLLCERINPRGLFWVFP